MRAGEQSCRCLTAASGPCFRPGGTGGVGTNDAARIRLGKQHHGHGGVLFVARSVVLLRSPRSSAGLQNAKGISKKESGFSDLANSLNLKRESGACARTTFPVIAFLSSQAGKKRRLQNQLSRFPGRSPLFSRRRRFSSTLSKNRRLAPKAYAIRIGELSSTRPRTGLK
jgi:hypothetical protein